MFYEERVKKCGSRRRLMGLCEKHMGVLNVLVVLDIIYEEIELITIELTRREMSNLRNRAKCCLRSLGQRMKDIIFKK